jgi:hypothetical protein
MVAQQGSTCWLTDRCEDVEAVVAKIEKLGGKVGRVLPLDGEIGGIPNCLYPKIIAMWQAKGYGYFPGFCRVRCERQDDSQENDGQEGRCPFIRSIAQLEEADTIVATKALARQFGFFSKMGNSGRKTVVLDEDPIKLLRPPVTITREELGEYLEVLDRIDRELGRVADGAKAAAGLAQSRLSRRIANWCWQQITRQQRGGQPEAVAIPPDLKPSKAVLQRTKKNVKIGRHELHAAFHRLMRRNPARTIRNVCRDLFELIRRAAGNSVFATSERMTFHLLVKVPKKKRVIVLDATANPELLRPLFPGRPVEVHCAKRVEPAGRVIQFMDFNGPRSYLNKIPAKPVRILDAIGDEHPHGEIILISHQSCVKDLAKASKHARRIRPVHFGNLRGRNDLEPSGSKPVACHVVMGSPKTTEEDRQQLALGVYGKSILPFHDLIEDRRVVLGRVPEELAEEDSLHRLWEVRIKGYADRRMQAVYEHTVTAELTHAADRARVLIHKHARVYLVTNEPCPILWFAELCLASDFLNLSEGQRARFEEACEVYEAKAKELLDLGMTICNADICRALERKPGWGKRYGRRFFTLNADALEGVKKFRWKNPE